ncbi:MAG TPA: hypothetical protein VNH11_29570 [Pirellulales bacterium]|nr:hypothetical protein [Pirellulales bacterium]
MTVNERWRATVGRLVLALALCLSGCLSALADEDWRFLLPEPGAEHEYPPLRAIPLAGEKPDDVTEKAEYRGSSRRYAQLRYGSRSAARVAIVVDQVSPGEVDLYVDANRNRTIEPKERCAGEGRLWRVPLNVEYAEGEVFKRFPRELVFRLGSTGRTLSYAAAGYLEGKLPLLGEGRGAKLPLPPGEGRGEGAVKQQPAGADGEPRDDATSPHPSPLPKGEGTLVAVRRMDGDANGFFTDPQDRLWIDLNRDGRWDAVEEQFLYATILTLAGQRYALRSDERGTMLTLAKLEGTGTIQLAVRQKPGKNSSEPGTLGRIAEIAVTLVGRDGSAVGLRGADAKATVPVGDYRVSAVAVSLDDPAGGPRWNFVFSDNQGQDAKRWYKLEKDAALAIDPLEKFDFSTGPWQTDGKCRPGDDLTFQPKLCTADGLLINTCYRGTHDTGRDGASATIKLATSDGTLLATAQSGFA